MSASDHYSASVPEPFHLFWTVGFAGKRFLHDNPSRDAGAEDRVLGALNQALRFLNARADEEEARLTAVSSVARGGDVLFARACLAPDSDRPALPWKCLLPFDREQFLRLDLESGAAGGPLGEDERRRRLSEAVECLEGAFAIEAMTGTGCDADADHEARVAAYLECGYRTVDEADVFLCLLRSEEFEALREAGGDPESEVPGGAPPAQPERSRKAGTLAVARYALASRRPCLALNVDVSDPWEERLFLNDPERRTGPESPLFHDPVVTPALRRCRDPFPEDVFRDWGEMPPGPQTPARQCVLEIQKRLGGLANRHRDRSQGGLKRMLTLHLGATFIAALGATALAFDRGDSHPGGALFAALILLALSKPAMALWAWWIEHRLHHHEEREQWLHCRVLAELCRGALSLWPMPVQPLKAADEEDFPKHKRLLRTLRLMRALDAEAASRGTAPRASRDPRRPWEGETQAEADMAKAVADYIEGRLLDQAGHYRKQLVMAKGQEACWRRCYQVAIWAAILFGLGALGLKLAHVGHGGNTHLDPHQWLALIVIAAPFVATYSLGMITILDCRRRVRRYPEMARHLERLAGTLADCQANASRLRLIEQAERMMIEEQHEWFSVTRNFSV